MPGQFLKLKKYCGINSRSQNNVAWNPSQNCLYSVSGRNIIVTYLSEREILDEVSDQKLIVTDHKMNIDCLKLSQGCKYLMTYEMIWLKQNSLPLIQMNSYSAQGLKLIGNVNLTGLNID